MLRSHDETTWAARGAECGRSSRTLGSELGDERTNHNARGACLCKKGAWIEFFVGSVTLDRVHKSERGFSRKGHRRLIVAKNCDRAHICFPSLP